MFKKIIFIFSFAFHTVLFAQNNPKNQPELKLKNLFYNFDTIEYNSPISYKFYYKNSGNQHLIIKNITTNCSCVKIDYSKLPLKKNKENFIEITYNAGTKGPFYKTVIIESNGKIPNISLFIKGVVW